MTIKEYCAKNYEAVISASMNDADILNFCEKNKNKKILITANCTNQISTDTLKKLKDRNYDVQIRIAHKSFEDLITYFDAKNKIWGNNLNSCEYGFKPTCYSIDEAILIIKEIEKLESLINPNWTFSQKVIFVNTYLSRAITYDNALSRKENASFRALLTKKGNCTSYSLLMSDILQRQGIECDCVTGLLIEFDEQTKTRSTGGHLWNVVHKQEKIVKNGVTSYEDVIFPIDVTGDSTNYHITNGKFLDNNFLIMKSEVFDSDHKPIEYSLRYCLRDQSSPLDKLLKDYQNPQKRKHFEPNNAHIIREEMDKRGLLPQSAQDKKEVELSR